MIENTSKRDAWVHLLGSMSDGPSDYILGMEADGQRQVVASEKIPTRCPQAELEALGFVFGPVDERDDLFRAVTLPAGWSRERSDHAMWSYIVDDKGRRRVSVFYKAAFYDRSAHAGLVAAWEPVTNRLYGDGEPAPLVFDDLLTPFVARLAIEQWLDDHDAERIERARAMDMGTYADEMQARTDRARAMLLEVEAAERDLTQQGDS